MKRASLLLLLFIGLNLPVKAQQNLHKVEGDGIITSAEVYIDEDGEKYASTFYVAFHQHIISDSERVHGIKSSNIRSKFLSVVEAIIELESERGLREINRLYPNFIPNDTLRKSRAGEIVSITDRSKVFKFEFDDIQPLSEIRRLLQLDDVRYIEAPEIIYHR